MIYEVRIIPKGETEPVFIGDCYEGEQDGFIYLSTKLEKKHNKPMTVKFTPLTEILDAESSDETQK